MEATMIMLDNSESSINGDHPPTRWDQQVQAATLLIEGKLADSAQASVGLGIMAGKRVQILCAPTNNSMKLTAYLFGVPIYGQIRLKEAIKTGLLAMKNRQNTNQRQRLVCMIASNITDGEQDLISVGKQLKKDNINLDIIVCGDETLPEFQEQRKKIESLMQGLKSTQSLTVWVPCAVPIRDAITSSSIFADRSGGEKAVPSAPSAGGNNDLAVDPNMDPELAMALQASRKQYEQMMKKSNQGQASQPANNKPMQQQQDEDAIAERRAIQLSLEEAAHVEAQLKAQKAKEQEQKGGQKKGQQKKQQGSKKESKAQDSELTKKHGDFISEFQKMDQEDDEEAKLKKKQNQEKK